VNEPTGLEKAISTVDICRRLGEMECFGICYPDWVVSELLSAAKQLEAIHTSFNERGAALVKLQGMLEALQKENEALTHSVQDWQSISETLKLALESTKTKLVIAEQTVDDLRPVLDTLLSTRAENARMREALVWLSGKKHDGECYYSDKVDEGCFLCHEAEQKGWHKVTEAISQPENTNRKKQMNETEQKTAEAILEKLTLAPANEVVQYATAYQALTQGALNRKNSERAK
jgi:hypothetical protein